MGVIRDYVNSCEVFHDYASVEGHKNVLFLESEQCFPMLMTKFLDDLDKVSGYDLNTQQILDYFKNTVVIFNNEVIPDKVVIDTVVLRKLKEEYNKVKDEYEAVKAEKKQLKALLKSLKEKMDAE